MTGIVVVFRCIVFDVILRVLFKDLCKPPAAAYIDLWLWQDVCLNSIGPYLWEAELTFIQFSVIRNNYL